VGTPQCRPWRSISYQATPAGPARPAGGKTLNKPHSKAGTVMENQPARPHQHDTEPLWAGWERDFRLYLCVWVGGIIEAMAYGGGR